MSTINEKDQDKMRLFTPGRNSEIDRAISDTERAIINTQKFLNEIRDSGSAVHEYIEEMRVQMEEQLRYLKNTKDFLLRDKQPSE